MQESTTSATNQSFAVEMRDICKAWPGVVANDRVNLRVRKGEIHALVGENGAGKSTLMNILYGLVHPDSGEIRIHGQAVQINGPRAAIKLGIGMVHQHFMLIPPLTVAENIVLGNEPGGIASAYKLQQARADILALSKQYGLPIDPDTRIEKLSVGLQQRVEILKMLYRGADILVMDEPTGVLTPQETDDLFAVLRTLVEQGKTIIFITHKLREILAITDTITVLRRGKNAGSLVTRETNQNEIARLMVGREVLLRVNKTPAQPGEVVLNVQGIRAQSDLGLEALHTISFEIRAGEILGIAGVEGNGQSELIEVVTGMRKATAGTITLSSQSERQMIELTGLGAKKVKQVGVAHIPEDRRGSGLVLEESIIDNTVLGRQRWPRFSRSGFILRLNHIARWAQKLIQDFDVRTPSGSVPVGSLSGGNQQKVIIARELACDPKMLVAAQPTRGVDIGAIEFIHRSLIEQRDAGKAILLISAELDEIRSLSDRIAVMYEGRIVDIVSPEATEEQLGILMAGGIHQESPVQA
ncbi:ABC transporter ATP-binding protein [Tengunoibacter tsumagoiensis]|uniref:Sugar ABC transporter ATP-binding protein n=1 Tax=Tengunoibacter tsumagoiensis TaxID=2014871 RepID=A0A402A9X1_9CHLR|nr:ABC transporter ATP-binding protein [Tengunoibacter tsumagoiensis]GCE15888.1 sugar ABC transporter ATP-binding protein [Tengunoibacter tsumagoiensis]